MRVLAFTTVLSLAGCATAAPTSYCTVHTLQPGASASLGLVRMTPAVESQLLGQLPAKVRSQYVCWYIAGRDLVVTNRGNSELTVLGYKFVQRAGHWVLSSQLPHIVALPKAIQ